MNAPWPRWVRLLGLAPLLFFSARFLRFSLMGEPGHVLWLCHFNNLALGVGLLLGSAWWVRLSAPWLAFGLPLWLWNISVFGADDLTTFGTHVGGALVGLLALSRVGAARRDWVWALGWYLLLQAVSRWLTPPAWNVNLAHGIYFGWEELFGDYAIYWLGTTLLAAGGLWLANWLFRRLWPASGPDETGPPVGG